ncbi:MAG: hypothetical protein LBV74_04080 [Tannerella sp.]|jgi:hypothetical protein|nr:hypothetical protein [Tannerella sp.]
MATYHYPKYKIIISPDSKKTQGLRVGDVVRRQYFDNPNLIYSLMIVLETGTDSIAENEPAYFIGALIEGDEPQNGELLDFVRITSLFDTDRSGALYLTASDSESPFMDVIDVPAFENSLCFPFTGGGSPDIPDTGKYACMGESLLSTSYKQTEAEAGRIFRITRNATANSNQKTGFRQSIGKPLEHSQRVIISYKIRASKQIQDVPVRFGYATGEETDGSDSIDIDTGWQYKLHLVTIDYPKQYRRSFSIDLTGFLLIEGDWAEIADLNIVLQADISTFSNATKARVGKIKGIIDPVFGVLDGYGAYFQNLYATRNVNIAGTLTAGDENGFSSTFYVGKIHKNVIPNSIEGEFEEFPIRKPEVMTPAGIGYTWQMGNSAKFITQSAGWRKSHIGEKYCFSLWVKADKPVTLSICQDEYFIQSIDIDSSDWRRISVAFVIQDSEELSLVMRVDSSVPGILVPAPQLEAGTTPSQYQPTDGTLSYVEDYGAWFTKGGIGGTIQNPLLKLNEDGSISSRDGSFVIKPDGTGHFASGRFKWTKDTITLQDVTIRWEDFDEEAKENMLPKSVSITGTDTFHYADELETAAEPEEIHLYATEHNFTGTSRKWQYRAPDFSWKDIPGENRDFIRITPVAHYWEERKTLSVRYVSLSGSNEYADIFTVNKLFDGSSPYSIYITSDKGTVFRNGIVSTVLKATVLKGSEDVTGRIPESNFRWIKTSDNPVADKLWNSADHTGKTLEITGDDVHRKAVFNCEVIIST